MRNQWTLVTDTLNACLSWTTSTHRNSFQNMANDVKWQNINLQVVWSTGKKFVVMQFFFGGGRGFRVFGADGIWAWTRPLVAYEPHKSNAPPSPWKSPRSYPTKPFPLSNSTPPFRPLPIQEQATVHDWAPSLFFLLGFDGTTKEIFNRIPCPENLNRIRTTENPRWMHSVNLLWRPAFPCIPSMPPTKGLTSPHQCSVVRETSFTQCINVCTFPSHPHS